MSNCALQVTAHERFISDKDKLIGNKHVKYGHGFGFVAYKQQCVIDWQRAKQNLGLLLFIVNSVEKVLIEAIFVEHLCSPARLCSMQSHKYLPHFMSMMKCFHCRVFSYNVNDSTYALNWNKRILVFMFQRASVSP